MASSEAVAVCEKCETPSQGPQDWCLRCGWHPRLKRHIELDPWDREDVPQTKPSSNLEVWQCLIPLWGWKLIAGAVLILAISGLARFLLPKHGPYRFEWTIAQILIGAVAVIAGHIGCYMFAIMENDRLTVLDILLKPLAIWATV